MNLNPFNKVRHLYDGRYEPEAVHALADAFWHFMISAALLLAFGSILLGFYEFMSVKSIQATISNSPATPQKTLFRPEMLEDALKSIDQRRAAYDAALIVGPEIADPSK